MVLLALLLAFQEAPIELPLPAGVDPAKGLRAIRVSDGKEVPARATKTSIVLLAAPAAADYRIESAAPAPSPAVDCVDDGKALVVSVGGKTVLRYNHAVVDQPDPVFSRSGYLHPISTPSGKTVTNDSPANHLHHHGIWSAWTSSEFEGRKSNFWESKEKQGKVEFVKIDGTVSGPVYGGFTVRHRFVNLTAPDGPKTALDEVWDVRVYALTDRYVFDLTSTQTAASDHPLVIKEYRYGGIGFRGSPEWEGKTGVDFLTSEGKGRVDGHATKAKWVLATGKLGGGEASVGFLCHPSNFRFPQPLRIHPDEPFFNWAVPQGGDFSIEPGKPYVAKYRFIVADGRRSAAQMAIDWAAYGEAPGLTLSVAK
ncbi:MAG: PmoA family protein [Planctomycetaceae bacterium]|nr:PmoA family protein [Planctomycetaceae bacterium]